MTAGDITHAIIRDRWRRNFCLPRFTPAGWWECDVWELTDAGYWREYEIKTSRADFRKDAEKSRKKFVMVDVPPEQRKNQFDTRRLTQQKDRNKHELLAAGDTAGPCQFWFVCPAGLIPVAEIPAWAGLIEITDKGGGQRRWRFRDVVVKPAPRLHGEKCKPAVAEKARESCYWRLHAAWGTDVEVHEPTDYTI